MACFKGPPNTAEMRHFNGQCKATCNLLFVTNQLRPYMGAHVHYSRRRGIGVEASECRRCGAYRTPFKPLTRQRRKRLAPGDEKLVCYPLSASVQWPNQGFWRGSIGGAEAAKCVFPETRPTLKIAGQVTTFFGGGEVAFSKWV